MTISLSVPKADIDRYAEILETIGHAGARHVEVVRLRDAANDVVERHLNWERQPPAVNIVSFRLYSVVRSPSSSRL
jgi:hypothetical protein